MRSNQDQNIKSNPGKKIKGFTHWVNPLSHNYGNSMRMTFCVAWFKILPDDFTILANN